jgi:hypothetical protein
MVRSLLTFIGGVIGAFVTLNGIYNVLRIDLRQDSLLTGAYCLLPILCFPVFFLVRPARRAAFLLAIMACGFLAAYSALNWRTCSELGYCTSVITTVLETLRTRLTLAFFAIAVISFTAEKINDRSSGIGQKAKSKG